jgi:chromosome segregation ATPase
MTEPNNPTKFIETERVLEELLAELNTLRSASEQISTAGNMARNLADTSNQVTARALSVVKKAEALQIQLEQAQFEKRFAEVNQKADEIKRQNGALLEAVEENSKSLLQKDELITDMLDRIEHMEKINRWLFVGLYTLIILSALGIILI